MQKLKNIVVIDGDEIGSFISQEVFRKLQLPYNITYISGVRQALEYLKKTYAPGAATVHIGQDLILLGMTVEKFELLDELEECQEIDCKNVFIVVLTQMFTQRDKVKLSKYNNIQACFPDMLSEPVIRQVLASYLGALPNQHNRGNKERVIRT